MSVDAWIQAQAKEREYWYPAGTQLNARRQQELLQHALYHRLTGCPREISGSVLELGAGPMPMLLSIRSSGLRIAVDPMDPEAVDRDRMRIAHVEFVQAPAETWRHPEQFDVVLLCNVLQHVQSTAEVMETAVHHSKRDLYVFEWVNEPVSEVHLHVITPVTVERHIPPEFKRVHSTSGIHETAQYRQAFYAAHWRRPS